MHYKYLIGIKVLPYYLDFMLCRVESRGQSARGTITYVTVFLAVIPKTSQ